MNHPVASHEVSVVIPAKVGIQVSEPERLRYIFFLDPGSVSGMTRRRKRMGIRPLLAIKTADSRWLFLYHGKGRFVNTAIRDP